MPKLRLIWLLYHSYSNILTVLIAAAAAALILPPGFTASISSIHLIFIGAVSLTAAVVVGVISGFRFTRNLRDRLEEISTGARNLAYGNLQYRLPFIDHPELGDIAQAFNEMADRLDKQVAALQKVSEENELLIEQTKVAAVSEERQRLARDLHDAVSQQLFAISMMAATASKVAIQNPPRCAELVGRIAESASRAQSEMRALLMQLRPVTLEGQRLVDALSSLAGELQSRQVIHCELALTDVDLPKHIENQLYRIAQEALSNVLRHAQASKCKIELIISGDNNRVLFVVEDDGIGFQETDVPPTSMGLKSIKERTEILGGTVRWISIPSQGTRLEVRLPLARTLSQE
ncbi:MAG TPA: HAMP domain-containing sensor histidine kinase [Firmicutes bacterium]|jgi:NarL family two-component system sensor histidine kinase LiaS|nr:HAMP domain-containing sensor histidine kinase [Bacillota bacterium]